MLQRHFDTAGLAVLIKLDTNMRTFLGYLVWLICLIGNGFMLFLVGLLSSNATGPPEYFYLASGIGAGLTIVGSTYVVWKKEFAAGAVITFFTIPLVLFFLFVLRLLLM